MPELHGVGPRAPFASQSPVATSHKLVCRYESRKRSQLLHCPSLGRNLADSRREYKERLVTSHSSNKTSGPCQLRTSFLRFQQLNILICRDFWHWAIANKIECSADGESTLCRVLCVSPFHQVHNANSKLRHAYWPLTPGSTCPGGSLRRKHSFTRETTLVWRGTLLDGSWEQSIRLEIRGHRLRRRTPLRVVLIAVLACQFAFPRAIFTVVRWQLLAYTWVLITRVRSVCRSALERKCIG